MQACLARLMLLFALASAACGCRMCQSCYDYCGPVVDPCGQPVSQFSDRALSIYSPSPDSPPERLSPANTSSTPRSTSR